MDSALTLLTGWYWFLERVVDDVEVNPEAVATAAVCLILLVTGLHLFASWLYRASAKEGEKRHWRIRWTVSLLSVVVLMFVAGIAAVGITHQTLWLIRDPHPGKMAIRGLSQFRSRDNLRQSMNAALGKQDREGVPPANLLDKEGSMLHSWHTMLLLYHDHDSIYKAIDLSKPWNDPVNQKALRRQVMPLIHEAVPKQQSEEGYYYSHYAGNVRLLGPGIPLTEKGIPDGMAQTIYMGEVTTNLKPWGQPPGWRDPALGLHRSPDGFGGPISNITLFGMADGSVRTIRKNVSPQVMKALSTPAGNEELGDDW